MPAFESSALPHTSTELSLIFLCQSLNAKGILMLLLEGLIQSISNRPPYQEIIVFFFQNTPNSSANADGNVQLFFSVNFLKGFYKSSTAATLFLKVTAFDIQFYMEFSFKGY
jgi:hypothetical protein